MGTKEGIRRARRGDLMEPTQSALLQGLLLRSSPQAYLSAVWKHQELISAQRVGGMLHQQREILYLLQDWKAHLFLSKDASEKSGGIQIQVPRGGGGGFLCLVCEAVFWGCISRKPHRLWLLPSWSKSIVCPEILGRRNGCWLSLFWLPGSQTLSFCVPH